MQIINIEQLEKSMNIPPTDKGCPLQEYVIKNKYPEFYNYVVSTYSWIKGKSAWGRKLYLCFHNLTEEPVCKECGNTVNFRSFQRGYAKFCCVTCASRNKEFRNQVALTCVKHFGVQSPMQSKVIQNKIKNTCKKRYGVENIFASKETQKKIKQINKEIYGVENPSQSKKIKEKKKQTCLQNYGVENPSQSKKIKEKKKQTCLQNYGVDHAWKSEKVRNNIKNTNFKRYGVEYATQNEKIKEKIKQTNQKKYKVNWYCQLINISNLSKFETRYLDYIEELIKPLGWTLKRNYNEILGDKELDGYIPEINKAFEFNGTYWHSMKNPKIKKDNHKYKFFRCLFKKINLLQVWEDLPFEVGCSLIKDFIFNKPLDNYKKELYKDLNNNEWPCDLGIPENKTMGEWREHSCIRNGRLCYDAGIINYTYA